MDTQDRTIRERFVERLEAYRRLAEILRQIHSNKAFTNKRRDDAQNMVTVVVAAFLTFVGFMGTARLHDLFALVVNIPAILIESVFNTLVFCVLAVVILNLIFRFNEKAAAHNRAIVILTGFIRDLDDLLKMKTFKDDDIEHLLHEIRERYKSITEILPPSTDDDFLKSKQDYIAKKQKSADIETKANQQRQIGS